MITTMERRKNVNQSLGIRRFQGRRTNLEKLMVIVDDQHLDMLDEMMDRKKWGVQVAYILTDCPIVRELFPKHSRIYPIHANIRSLLRHDVIDEIVCCTSSLSDAYINELAEICQQFGVSLLVQPYSAYSKLPISGIRDVANYYFMALETNPRKCHSYSLKSMIEIVFASLALFILSPFLFIIALLIKYTSPGPIFFMQKRVGLRGRKFSIYKFRTMIADAENLKESLKALNETDGPAFKIAEDPRITKVGRILRKTGIDEIPQLINIIKGEMSLIGPRPMLPEEVYAQEEWQLKRLCIKPGITCTWQIQPDRNDVPFEKWMQLDRDYVENWSIGSDMKIFFSTIKSLLAPSGV
jgi:exopolysaccharide biosynthesis polyprenyl glycosylphosphotransferase